MGGVNTVPIMCKDFKTAADIDDTIDMYIK